MKQHGVIYAIFGLLFGMLVSLNIPAHAENHLADESNTLTLYIENDVFAGTDREYTNGTKLTWISKDFSDLSANPHLPHWSHPLIEHLPFVNREAYQKTVSFSFGQNMYTPDDI